MEGKDLKVKLHADKCIFFFFYFIFVFLCDELAAAANTGFQFSKHLGLPCLLNVCKKREAQTYKLYNKSLKVKDKILQGRR